MEYTQKDIEQAAIILRRAASELEILGTLSEAAAIQVVDVTLQLEKVAADEAAP